MKRVSLVLGSGGARGLAHIGVIHWLKEHGYEIATITGSSMGALVGGIEAADKLDEYERWVRAVRKIDILALMDVSLSRGGLVKGEKIIRTLIELVGDQDISELTVPYTAIAVDINAKKEVWIQDGLLFDAIRASISVPLFFNPAVYRGLTLVDGGVLNPVPIAPTFADRTDLTVAVNPGGPETELPIQVRDDPPLAQNIPTKAFTQAVADFIDRFRNNNHEDPASDNAQQIDMQSIAVQAFEAMQNTIARQKLAAYPPDVLIDIPSNICSSMEYDRAAELIDVGYLKAGESMAGQAGQG